MRPIGLWPDGREEGADHDGADGRADNERRIDPKEPLPQKARDRTCTDRALRHQEAADHEEDEDTEAAGDVVGAEKAHQRLIFFCALTEQKSVREDDRASRDEADEIEIRVTRAG